MTRLFLDTNIVVDLLDRREPFCHDAVRIFTMAYNRQVQLFVSPMTFTTASFLLRRHGTEGVRNLLSNFHSYPVLPPLTKGLSTIRWLRSSKISRMLCNITLPLR